MKNYFENCSTFADVQKKYRELCKTLHPDKGGNKEDFAEMQNQFETFKAIEDAKKNRENMLHTVTISADKANKEVNKVIRTFGYGINTLVRAYKNVSDDLHSVVVSHYVPLFKYFGIDLEKKRLQMCDLCFVDFGGKKGKEVAYLVNVRVIVEKLIAHEIEVNQDNEKFVAPDYNTVLAAYLEKKTYVQHATNEDWYYFRAMKSIKGIVLSICSRDLGAWLDYEKNVCVNTYANKRALKDISLHPEISLNQFIDAWKNRVSGENMIWDGKKFVFTENLDTKYPD